MEVKEKLYTNAQIIEDNLFVAFLWLPLAQTSLLVIH